MSPGQPDPTVVRRHLLALDEALEHLRRHARRPLSVIETDPDERWTVERGLQLCAQNVLDIATHLAASAGRDAPDYASATKRWQSSAFSPPTSRVGFEASPVFGMFSCTDISPWTSRGSIGF